jgi:hypothetical protein
MPSKEKNEKDMTLEISRLAESERSFYYMT